MDIEWLTSQFVTQWVRTVVTGVLGFAVGILVSFVLLRFRFVAPKQLLVSQSPELSKPEQERQRWLRLLQDAIESAPNGFSVYDASKRLVVCNAAFTSLYGGDASALVGCTTAEFYARILPLIQTVNGHLPERLEKTPQSADYSWLFSHEPTEIQLRDGRWLLLSRHPTAEGGNVFVHTDITRLKQMQQALWESEQRFRSIAEAHPVPVVVCALEEGELLYVSPGTTSLFGAPVTEIIASSPQRFFASPEDLDKIKAILLDKGTVDSYECTMKTADGSTFPVAVTARRIDYLGADAAVGGIIDLTEIRRAEEEIDRQREVLHQSEKLNALGSLLAGVAHELNNPLSVVVGRSIMLEGEVTAGETRTRIRKIRLAAERCARIVKTFLAIARQQPPERASVQLNAVIEAAVELISYGLRTADIETILDLDRDLPELSADADQLTQVFTNLIINAQQALLDVPIPRRLRIATHTDSAANAVRIEFTDNGRGVPAEIRSRIFEPFYTSKPVGAGTGIGLSFSYGVIECHGGKLSLENPRSGGARFVITLPIVDASTAMKADRLDRIIRTRPHAILVIDDELEIAEMLSEVLKPEGHHIDIVASGNQALQQLANHSYDLILSDLKMPDLDGACLYRRLQRVHPHLLERIVFITGDTLGMGASEFLAQTGRPVIEKPFVPNEIIQVVRETLARAD